MGSAVCLYHVCDWPDSAKSSLTISAMTPISTVQKLGMRGFQWFVSGLAPQAWPVEAGLFLLRFYTGLSLMLTSGRAKVRIRQLELDQPFLDILINLGVPFPIFFAWVSASVEIIGAVLFALGLGTRPMGLLLAINMAVAAFPYYRELPLVNLNLPQLLFWVFVCFTLLGSGRWSIDHLLRGWLKRRGATR